MAILKNKGLRLPLILIVVHLIFSPCQLFAADTVAGDSLNEDFQKLPIDDKILVLEKEIKRLKEVTGSEIGPGIPEPEDPPEIGPGEKDVCSPPCGGRSECYAGLCIEVNTP